MKKNLLWISLFIPYDNVSHAGGKIHNYYLKMLHKSEQFHIKLLTFATPSDMNRHDLDQYRIDHTIICYNSTVPDTLVRAFLNVESTYNPYNRYGRALQNYDILQIHSYLKKYAKSGYRPDIIILQWTQIAFMLPFVKKCFPAVPVITIEEDVTYLSYQRKMHYYPTAFLRYISKRSYAKVKTRELSFLKDADAIILNNHKDKDLLIHDGINKEKLFVWNPYFQNYLTVGRKPSTHTVIFYGGMHRPENYLSAIWFAEKVMPLLSDTDITFQIIGNNPDKKLYKYASDRITITGFVEHVEDYLSSALCLAAPLVFGAGVKIKILEAMSAGLPVLTNDVGIEGISAQDGKDYFHCISPKDYADKIKHLMLNERHCEDMQKAAKDFIQKNYNLEESVHAFLNLLQRLLEIDKIHE